ncbi:DUF4150 domain-containing protein [Caballeronia sp. NK8]|uniref:DUF4150 domain-containing protein n=1 Tax=Caballeronia sp. NK8 TaxID=140098 RepID=UPI001BB67907|nr:DUF4150 domain-containing protein [Caballeronia sp. NK8]BCQ25990.1 DUF4150 domain-containing protein [Caballeronia sp. NK8]
MADNVIARKDRNWTIVSLMPDVCKTPVGGSTPPVPYPVTATLASSAGVISTVRANGHALFVFDASYAPETNGDQAGSANGVASNTVGAKCSPIEKSSTVRAQGKYVVRHGDMFWMNGE